MLNMSKNTLNKNLTFLFEFPTINRERASERASERAKQNNLNNQSIITLTLICTTILSLLKQNAKGRKNISIPSPFGIIILNLSVIFTLTSIFFQCHFTGLYS